MIKPGTPTDHPQWKGKRQQETQELITGRPISAVRSVGEHPGARDKGTEFVATGEESTASVGEQPWPQVDPQIHSTGDQSVP